MKPSELLSLADRAGLHREVSIGAVLDDIGLNGRGSP